MKLPRWFLLCPFLFTLLLSACGAGVAMQINSDKSAVGDHAVTLAGIVLDTVGPLEEKP